MKITHLSLLLSAPLLSMGFLLILSGLSGLSLMMTSCVDQPSALPPLDQDIERQSDEDMDDSTPAPRDQFVSDMNLNISDLTPLDLWIEDQELALQDLSIDMRDPLPPELISPDPIDLSISPLVVALSSFGSLRQDCMTTSPKKRSRVESSPIDRDIRCGRMGAIRRGGFAYPVRQRSIQRTWITGNSQLGLCSIKSSQEMGFG